MTSRTFISVLLVILALILFTPSLQAQTSRYIDDDAPGDPGPGDPLISDPLEDGTTDHPFDAIQEGIDTAVNGDTVLVLDGTYTGDGNWDMDFLGKAITVASANGPDGCIVEGGGSWADIHYAFMFENGEGPDSILRGFTITNFKHEGVAAGINISGSPTIIGNVLTNNEGFDGGGAMMVSGSPLIIDNVFTNNTSEYSGAIMIWGESEPLIFNNLLTGNVSYNKGYGDSGAIYCFCYYYGECRPLIVGCTIADNFGGGYASGIYANEEAVITVRDSVVWGNWNGQIYAFNGSVTYSDVEGGFPGTGNINTDPLFVSGPDGDYRLSQLAAGQAEDSPCVDVGSDPAIDVCATLPTGESCLGDGSTRTDGIHDSGQADMGYHDTAGSTVSASFSCVPSSGTLPFRVTMCGELENLNQEISRRIAGKINVKLAGGQGYSSWRAGFTNVGAGDSYIASWTQTIPALGSLVGDNRFTLIAEDVTPPPYNLPPYPPAGDTGMASCTVTGEAP